MRQDKIFSQVGTGKSFNSPLYSETTKSEKKLKEINAKITERSHAYKGYASTYSVKILNSFNPELYLKDIEYAIRNKLTDLLTELKGFGDSISFRV